MVVKTELIRFYIVLRRYKDHDKCLALCVKHFYPKVSSRMTVKDFSTKVEIIIDHALTTKTN